MKSASIALGSVITLSMSGCSEPEIVQNPRDLSGASTPTMESTSASFVDPQPLLLGDLKSVIYSRDFAARFGLSEEGISDLVSPDLHAIEFSVERIIDAAGDVYTCNFKVYLNSELALENPGGLAVSNVGAVDAHHFFDENFDGWQPVDIEIFSSRLGEFNMKAFLSSSPDSPRQIRESLLIVEHHEHLFEGVSYRKVRGCMIFSDAISADGINLELWLKANQGSNNSEATNADSFVKLQLPKQFVNQIGPMMKRVSEKNSQLMSLDVETDD